MKVRNPAKCFQSRSYLNPIQWSRSGRGVVPRGRHGVRWRNLGRSRCELQNVRCAHCRTVGDLQDAHCIRYRTFAALTTGRVEPLRQRSHSKLGGVVDCERVIKERVCQCLTHPLVYLESGDCLFSSFSFLCFFSFFSGFFSSFLFFFSS